MRIVQLANAYGPHSGGLRTTVDTLGRGYIGAGHDRVLIVPGPKHNRRRTEEGLIVTLPGMRVGGGYRMIARFAPVAALLDELRPDSIEASDKTTLVQAGQWARERGVGAVLISHERLDAIAAARYPVLTRTCGRTLTAALRKRSRRLAKDFDAVVVASAFAQEEFSAIGAPAHRIPLGVDLEVFHPAVSQTPVASDGSARLVYVGRLSPEKNPGAPIGAVRQLVADGVDVRLDVYGTGSALPALRRGAKGLPIEFHGHLRDRAALASVVATADVALAPGRAETFGLTVLESLACGTPVVTADTGAAGELLAPYAGLAAPSTPSGLAGAIAEILSWPAAERRCAARRRAEQFPWSATIDQLLELHKQIAVKRYGANTP